jgi:hypothetical protein
MKTLVVFYSLEGNTFKHLRAALQGNEVLGEIALVEPLRKGPDAAGERVRQWAAGIQAQAGAAR